MDDKKIKQHSETGEYLRKLAKWHDDYEKWYNKQENDTDDDSGGNPGGPPPPPPGGQTPPGP
jgi:hypothetical protein